MTQAPPAALLVDDDETIATLLRFLLQRQGWAVQRCADGAEAMQAIEHGPVPQLVLLDMMLPVHDGLALLQKLRSLPAWRDVPVVMLTGKDDQALVDQAFAAGANDYVSKPFNPVELGQRLAKYRPA
jgi:CheY-like chemotaxis protein